MALRFVDLLKNTTPGWSYRTQTIDDLAIKDKNGVGIIKQLFTSPSAKKVHPIQSSVARKASADINKLRFSYVGDSRLAGLAYPELINPADAVIDFLCKEGVSTLVNLTTADYVSPEYRSRLTVLWEPVANMAAPEMEQVDRLYSAYCELPPDNGMGVHCAHGVGRTGTVIACLIGRKHAMPAEQVIALVRKARPGSIESEEQELFISEYLAARDN